MYRSCLCIYEYVWNRRYYDYKKEILQIIPRCFTINVATILTLLLLLPLIFYSLKTSLSFNFMPPAKYLTYIPWLLLYRFLSMHYSQLDYAKWIREEHGLDYAQGMASNYFHGYLKLSLPSHKGHAGLHERIQLYEDQHGVEFVARRLVG